ncbi:MAG: SulP family inorganic anion transporter [Candidatus Melainabacteria bacterium]|nr:SulP family inorganic anion transporter [Candidatus Melainabacteria bacterium]
MISKKQLPVELTAGLLLFFVALPLNIGVAIASGVSPEQGIISGLIGAVVAGSLSGCGILVSGPDAGVGVLLLEMLTQHGIASIGALVIIAGCIQLAIGLSKTSHWFRMVSPAVVNGMLAGMGLLIICTQFHIMLDDSPKDTGFANLIAIPYAITNGLLVSDMNAHHIAAMLGAVTISIACLWKRIPIKAFRFAPPALVAILTASLATILLNLPVQKVDLPNSLSVTFLGGNFASFSKPFLDPQIWISAAILSLVLSAQTTITLNAIENLSPIKKGYKLDREFIAQGMGNLLCGLVGALPVVGVLLRSVTNLQSGAQTKIPNIFHGVMMLVAILAFPRLLEYMPRAALAAVLVFIGFTMTQQIWERTKPFMKEEKIIMLLTVVAIMVTNLFTGIIIGLCVAAAKELYQLTHLSIKVFPADRGVAIMQLAGAATFLHLPRLVAALEEWEESEELHVRLDKVTYIDHGCLQTLVEWEAKHKGKFFIDWENAALPGQNVFNTGEWATLGKSMEYSK